MAKTLDVMQQNNWAYGGSAGYARYEFSDDFVDENERQFEAGPKSYLEVSTTISGSVVTVPAYPDFPETEAAITNNGVTVTCHLLDSNRIKRTTLFEDCRIYTSLPSVISLSQLVLANGASRIQRDTDVWTKEQVIDYVETRPPAAKMTSLAYGTGRLSVPAALAGDPIVPGDNDPRLLQVSTYAQLLAALGSNKTIRIASGATITPTTTLLLTGISNLTIEGVDESSVVDLSGLTVPGFNVRNTSRITFRNFKLKGDFGTSLPTQPSQQGIVTDNASSAQFCDDLTIENMYFENLRGDCIRIGPNTRRTKITNTRMLGGLGFLEISGVDVLGDSRPVVDLTLSKFTIKGTLSGGISGGTLSGSDDLIDCYGGATDIRIEDGSMEIPGATAATTSCNSSGILLNPDFAGQGSIKRLKVSNVQFKGFNSTAVGVPNQAAIGLEAHGDDCFEDILIDGVQVDNSHYGISVADGVSKGIKIGNYTISNCRRGVNIANSDDVEDSNGTIRFPTEIGMFIQGHRVRTSNLRLFIDSALTLGVKVGIYSTTGDNQQIDTPHIYGAAATSRSIAVVGGSGTQIISPEIIGQTGTSALDVEVGASNTLITNPHFASNTTNFSNASTTTIIRGLSGTGSPETVVAAAVSSTYLRTNGGAGTTFYVKEVGNGTVNTGWAGK